MRATHATATGKAILAWLPEQVVANVISENGLQRFTDNTIVSLSELMDDLRLVRRNGYAEDNEELREGVACIGAALRDESGTVVASISASFPAGSVSGEQRDVVIRKVTQYARELSGRLKVNRY
jgi:IclR family acetate operon transcriptional repressor